MLSAAQGEAGVMYQENKGRPVGDLQFLSDISGAESDSELGASLLFGCSRCSLSPCVFRIVTRV